jgi:hypothetical protein
MSAIACHDPVANGADPLIHGSEAQFASRPSGMPTASGLGRRRREDARPRAGHPRTAIETVIRKTIAHTAPGKASSDARTQLPKAANRAATVEQSHFGGGRHAPSIRGRAPAC